MSGKKSVNLIETVEELFERWKTEGAVGKSFNVFCKDGIVDEFQFDKRRILFVLKDVHLGEQSRAFYEQQGEIDMRTEVCGIGEGRTWNPVALWAKALIDDDVKPFAAISAELSDKQQLRDIYLKKIAFLNLKKEAGDASVSNQCVRHYAKADAVFLRQQIKIINPDIIIACSAVVFEAMKECAFENAEVDDTIKITLNSKMSNYGNVFDIGPLIGRNRPLYVVKYCHPNNRGSGSCTYEEHYDNMLHIRELLI